MMDCHFCFRLKPLPALQFHETVHSLYWLELASFYCHREFPPEIAGTVIVAYHSNLLKATSVLRPIRGVL